MRRNTMLEIISYAATGAIAVGGYVKTRNFVRDRLRFVDAMHRPAAPWVVGVAVALVALPVVAVVPFIGGGTALLLGVGVGVGVRRGSKEVRRIGGG